MASKPKKSLGRAAAEALVNVAWRLFQEQMLDSIPAQPLGSEAQDEEFVLNPIMGRFTTQNKGFGTEVLACLDLLTNYASRTKVDRPLNILLAAAPGTGKSFLAKEFAQVLARELKDKAVGRQEVSFEEVHVGAFRNADDLIGVLQRVQSENLKGRLPVVLFDEVDGKVGGQYLFASFLAPMWDGKFYVGSSSYAIGPAIFLFAASNLVSAPTLELYRKQTSAQPLPVESQASIEYSKFASVWKDLAQKEVAGRGDEMPKCIDFVDRIDLMLCMPPVEPDLIGHDAVKTENTALILGWVLKHFPFVTRVEIAIVAALGEKLLKDKRTRRDVERSIFLAKTPDSSTLSFSNLPAPDRMKFGESEVVAKSMGRY